jgi:hypothetical protein
MHGESELGMLFDFVLLLTFLEFVLELRSCKIKERAKVWKVKVYNKLREPLLFYFLLGNLTSISAL